MGSNLSEGGIMPALTKKSEERDRTSVMQMESNADDILQHLGYSPELSRNRSTLQAAFMSFVLASIPYGLATTLFYPLVGGGPVNIIWGWLLVSLIMVAVAISLGEITSVYPTAGGTSEPVLGSPACLENKG